MYEKNRSGQWLYFGMNSSISGFSVTGIATAISGRVSLDGGAQAVVAGPISEIGGGQYVLGMFAADINANIAGYLFTSSGCVSVSFTVPTTANVSGKIFPNSGLAVNLLSGNVTSPYSGSLSGQLVNLLSGNLIAILSGTFVNVFSGSLSGQQLTARTVTDKTGYSLLSGILSGQLVDVLVNNDKTNYLIASGNLSGQQVVTQINLDKSGYVIGTNLDKTGYTVLSGTTYLASGLPGYSGTIFIASGPFVNAYLNSGSLSGQLVDVLINNDKSGYTVGTNLDKTNYLVASGNLSGQQVNLLSGNMVSIYSGTRVNVFSGNVFTYSGFQTDNATTLLKYDMSGITGEATRSPINALRKLMNKWDTSGTTLTVFKENDSTAAFTQTLVATSGAEPITSLDTN